VFYDDKMPCKQAKFPHIDLLVLDVIADFELSATVVSVVSYISMYILKGFMLQFKCLDCLRMLTDTSKGAKHKVKTAFGSLYATSPNFPIFLNRMERVFQINIHKVVVLNGILSRLLKSVYMT